MTTGPGEAERLRREVDALRTDRTEAERRLFAADFVPSHRITSRRQLRSREAGPRPTVLVAILAKQKEKALPLYLKCLEELDYPKSQISIYIRTNNNTDQTEEILRRWVDRVGKLYRSVEFDASDIPQRVQDYEVHEWNAERLKALARIRNGSLHTAIDCKCDFYFVCDVDNFIVPWTLSELIQLGLPIVAPLLRDFSATSFNSNFFSSVDSNGYYRENNTIYFPVLTRSVRGVIE